MKNFKSYSITALIVGFLFDWIGFKVAVTPLLIVSAVCFVLYYLFGREKNAKDTGKEQGSHKRPNYTATTWWYMENNSFSDGGDCSAS